MTLEAELNRFRELFADYRSFEEEFWPTLINEEKDRFTKLKDAFKPVDETLQRLLKVEAPHYNIFQILKIGHYEARVHTPFLCHLLDPKGSHEQGSLFLNSFFERVLQQPFSYQSVENFRVHQETRNSNGQLDIHLEFTSQQKRKAIVIENKIYAGDQADQLRRYYRHFLDDLKLSNDDIWLVYLTPRCMSPSEYSLDLLEAKNLRESGRLLERGYHQHIIPWLESCCDKITSQKVQYIVFQYLQTLRSL